MTKQDVIDQISEQTGLDPLTTRSIIESFFEVVKEALIEGKPIYIRTFGSFILKQRAAKVGRNIPQNTAVTVAAHVIPFFKPGADFINQVRAQDMPVSTKKQKA